MTADSDRGDRADLEVIGALAEPNRRALYDYVTSRGGWVSREDAADGVGLQRGIAAHHLDRLAADGFLEVDARDEGHRIGAAARQALGRRTRTAARRASMLDQVRLRGFEPEVRFSVRELTGGASEVSVAEA